jgi:hypothetical protein
LVTVGTFIVVAAAIYAGLAYYLGSKPAFFGGVAVTLAFWGAPFVLPPSYANALYVLLGSIGSAAFGLIGIVAWWRSRELDGGPHWSWFVGSALVAVVPAALMGFYELLRP